MNLKTTLVLLVLCGLLVAAWIFAFGTRLDDAAKGPLFADFLAEDATTIRLEDRSKERLQEPVVLRAGPDGSWSLETASIDGGRAVRARKEVVVGLLDAIRSVVALGQIERNPSLQDCERFGLGERQKAIVEIKRQGREKVLLEFGTERGSGQIAARRGGDDRILAVATEIRNQSVPLLDRLEDPALLALSVLDIERMILRPAAGHEVELERRFDRWWLIRPAQVLADDRKADQIRNAILDIKVVGRLKESEVPGEAFPDPAPWRITLFVQGRKEPVELVLGARVDEVVPVRIAGDPLVRLVPAAILGLLEPARGSLRDPGILQGSRSEIAGIRVFRGPDRLFAAHREDQEWLMDFEPMGGIPVERREIDRIMMGRFLDRLTGLRIEDYASPAREFLPALKVEIDRLAAGATALTTVTVGIGAEVKEGRIPIRIAAEAGSGTVDSASTAFLDAPYWTLLERRNRLTHGYMHVGRFTITDASSKSVTVVCRIEKAGEDLKGRAGLEATAREVPESMLHPATKRLIDFTLKEFLGTEKVKEMGFDEPFLVLRVFHADEGKASGIPENSKGHWRELRVGARRDDGLWFATTDDELGLVFLLEQSDIQPYLTLLKEFGG